MSPLGTNANWDAEAAKAAQLPVYVLQINGVSDEFCTHRPIDAGATVYRVLMNTPSGGGGAIDILDGRRNVGSIQVELLDESGRITDIVATEAAGAPVSTLVNRSATILAGYIGLDISDYVAVFTGRVRGVRMNSARTGYILTLQDLTSLFDAEIFSNATDTAPSYIEGNVVNCYASILRGTFSTSDPDFPLDAVSTASKTGSHDGGNNQLTTMTDSGETWVVNEFVGLTITNDTDGSSAVITSNTVNTVTHAALTGGTDNDWDTGDNYTIGSSAPTGLGIAAASLDVQRLKDQRDAWHVDDVVRVITTSPEVARGYLADEFFRIFQAWPTITGGGKIGVSFHTPSQPLADPADVDESDIVSVDGWERVFGDHLNSFRFNGDYDFSDGSFAAALYSADTSEDTTDQTNTGETRQYVANSKWIRTTLNGVEMVEELADRHRIRYLKTPAILSVSVNFTKRTIEEGDVVAVTLRDVPNLFDGTRGITAHLMTVLSMSPAWAEGVLKLKLMDMGFKRYGVIAPDSLGAAVTFANATEKQKNTFFAFCNTSNQMSDGSPGYRFS